MLVDCFEVCKSDKYCFSHEKMSNIYVSVFVSTKSKNSFCAGVANGYSGTKTDELCLLHKYYSFPQKTPYKKGSYLGTPSMFSKECTSVGIYVGNRGGKRCAQCQTLFKQRGSSHPNVLLNSWYKKYMAAFNRRSKSDMTTLDLIQATALKKVPDIYFSEEGLHFKEEAVSQVDYCDYVSELPSALKKKLLDRSDAPSSSTSFLEKISDLYENNPSFRESLVVGMLKASVDRMLGNGNDQMSEKVVNFYRFVATYSPRAAQVVSANLNGPSKRWMQTLNSRERKIVY